MSAAQDRPALHAMTAAQLSGYRRQLERAIAFFARQHPIPRIQADLQTALRGVLAAQDPRQETPRD